MEEEKGANKMENELTRNLENGMNLDDQMKQADMFIKSGFFPRHIDTPAKAIVIIQKGRELGLPKTEALSKISVINGQPCTKVETLLGLARRTGQLEDLIVKDFPDYCETTIKRKGQTPHTCRFGDVEALAMGLTGKDNYKKQKGTMYQWRSLAKNLRVTFPDAIGGLYLEEEIADDVIITPVKDNEPAIVTEVIPKISHTEETQSPKEENASLKAIDIPDDQLGNWVMPLGKYQGKRLIEILAEVTDSGKAKGREYLEWIVENGKNPEYTEVIKRFVAMIDKQ